jgi:dephospho-CoA kinase
LLQAQFGPACIDAQGAMDRSRMRELVFADPAAKQALEGLLHPLITEEAETQAAASAAEWHVFDVPLLIETGRWRHKLHRIIVVDCDEATQIQRVAQRPGWTQALASQVVRQQAPRDARRACADVLIDNQHVDLQGLTQRVSVAVEQLRRWACETMRSTP